MTTKIKLYTLLLICSYSYLASQIGINTTQPTKTLDVNGNMRIRQVNTITEPTVLAVEANGSVYKINELKLLPSIGEIKYGMQKTDHTGWYLLNGRAVSTISSSIARNNAVSLGFTSVLIDARNRFIKDTSENVGTTNGNNTYTLSTQNIPNYSVSSGTTGTSGNHNHTANDFYLDTPGNSAARTGTSPNCPDCNYYFTTTSTSSATSANIWNHSHTASGSVGGSSQPFSIEPQYITINVFMYLGE